MTATERAAAFVALVSRVAATWDALGDGAKTAMPGEDIGTTVHVLRRVAHELVDELQDRIRQRNNLDLPGNEP